MVDKASLLALYPALDHLPEGRLEQLLKQLPVHIPAGSLVFTEQQPCQGFPLILSGCIKVQKISANGREILLYRVEPGGSCIITSSCLLGHSPYSAQGVAETDLTLLPLPMGLFETMLAEHAPFREFVFHLFANRIAELMTLVEEVAFSRLDQRLAKLLLGRGERVIHATHQQLAEELGSVREIISRLLKGFAAQGWLTLGREQIVIVDQGGLESLAQGGR